MKNPYAPWELTEAKAEAADAKMATQGSVILITMLWLVWGIDEPQVSFWFTVLMSVLGGIIAMSWLGATLRVRALEQEAGASANGEDAP